MHVKIDDILHMLVSRSAAPSTFGAQLDRLRFGLQATPDPFRAREEVENAMLDQAVILRCMDDFVTRQEFRGNVVTALDKVQKLTRPKLSQGYIALSTLRAYQEWSTQSQERALVAVYHYLASIAPAFVPPPPKNEPDLLLAFRTNKAKRARSKAADVYADSLLALGNHVTSWNKRENRQSRAAS